jgi:hypothetical protein
MNRNHVVHADPRGIDTGNDRLILSINHHPLSSSLSPCRRSRAHNQTSFVSPTRLTRYPSPPDIHSRHVPNIPVPRDITTWEFLFEHPTYSPLHRFPPPHQAGFTDAITKERLSWPDVRTAATHLSTALVHHHGLRPADTVALFSPNTIWYPVAMHATLRAGGRVTGASPAYTVDEMTYALRKADVRFLMTHPDSVDVAVEAARAVGLPRRNVFLLEGRRDGFVSVSDLIRLGAAADAQIPYWTIPDGNTNADVCGFLAFSSGTTGLPKAVMCVLLLLACCSRACGDDATD